MVKHVFPINELCLETKQMWLKSCVARNGDPCLKPRSFSQPQIFFQQFCFHEIRLTDKMLQCTKIHNFSLISLRDIYVYF